jgi:hypothetical protein
MAINLVDPNINKQIDKAIRIQELLIQQEHEQTLMFRLKKFFYDWMWPNKYLILLLTITGLCLYYRYDDYARPKIIDNKSSVIELASKVQTLTRSTLQTKNCGHAMDYPCVCNMNDQDINNFNNIINSGTVSNTNNNPANSGFNPTIGQYGFNNNIGYVNSNPIIENKIPMIPYFSPNDFNKQNPHSYLDDSLKYPTSYYPYLNYVEPPYKTHS